MTSTNQQSGKPLVGNHRRLTDPQALNAPGVGSGLGLPGGVAHGLGITVSNMRTTQTAYQHNQQRLRPPTAI